MSPDSKSPLSSMLNMLHTIWLFTANDIKSIVLPETAFGIFTALSGPLLTSNPSVHVNDVLSRLPQVLLWNWANLLLFDVANQRLPASVVEDAVNKAWRPLPSGRISELAARRLLLGILPATFIVSWFLGGMHETVAMMALTWMYNDLAGSDELYIIRNAINALGFMCYSSGSAAVAVGHGEHDLNSRAYQWIALVGAVVFSTLSMQDMPDIPGDRTKGRKTLPLVHPEIVARWAIGVPVFIWSVYLSVYWELHVDQQIIFGAVVAVGAVLAARVIFMRGIQADKGSWKMWCAWTGFLYALPMIKNCGHLVW
ncbi:hypothetical protein EJ05DRAFT_502092 [Pseudovirgaria hyperparasitica]|uniref:UbiA prenyltransferase n=1 Tax=Pseudovirgaria hyperparasitica TaxID=470096 RepID=A0A6A6W3K3_9PEZI|nr:uncharacterized protein EJ05DRAFT_502092 [Pseudovirgaria hyperparasitica]KAF2756594.1 hypothetical protein EJ05DRAFT_502092 [Pseudovirgaria hyperparasitica]